MPFLQHNVNDQYVSDTFEECMSTGLVRILAMLQGYKRSSNNIIQNQISHKIPLGELRKTKYVILLTQNTVKNLIKPISTHIFANNDIQLHIHMLCTLRAYWNLEALQKKQENKISRYLRRQS